MRAVPDVLAARFDAEREPTDPGAAQFAQHLRLDRVDACIGPEIQVKAALDQPVANCVYVPIVQHKHLVDDLEGADAVFVVEVEDLTRHRFG